MAKPDRRLVRLNITIIGYVAMETEKTTADLIALIAERHGRYRKEAYYFIFEALDHTLRRIKEHRHVSGRELLQGISEYARDEYGPMAKIVFEYWGVTRTEDFGHIVFHLVEAGLMGKTETDSLDDFKNVFDFEEEFVRRYKAQ